MCTPSPFYACLFYAFCFNLLNVKLYPRVSHNPLSFCVEVFEFWMFFTKNVKTSRTKQDKFLQ